MEFFLRTTSTNKHYFVTIGGAITYFGCLNSFVVMHVSTNKALILFTQSWFDNTSW